MIFKSEIIEAINDLNHDTTALAIRINEMERRLNKIERKTLKPTSVSKQPRSKDGKFAKKN